MDLAEALAKVGSLDERAMRNAQEQWNSVAKPIGSLGVLEELVIRIAGITGNPQIDISKRGVVAFCADNGVVAEGVTQTGQEITRLVARTMAQHSSSVCLMGSYAGIDVIPIDIGMAEGIPEVRDMSIARGTNNIATGPAMTRAQAVLALETGIALAGELKDAGYGLLLTGEMGIGNTTTSSAVASVLLGEPPQTMTGRGAGLSDEGLARKLDVIERAIALNQPNPDDALDVLAKLGGFDIAGMAGLFIGGALHRVPVLVDGFISAVAALVAQRICPECAPFMIASHASAEPAFGCVMQAAKLKPLIFAEMRLGEGTGAVCLVPLLDMALAVYGQASSFEQLGMEAYDASLVEAVEQL